MKRQVLFFYLCCLTLLGNAQVIEKMSFTDLFYHSLSVKDESLLSRIDCILEDSLKVNKDIVIIISDYNAEDIFTPVTCKASVHFYDGDYDFLYRNEGRLEITPSGSIFWKDSLIKDLSRLESVLKEFILNPLNKSHLPEKELCVLWESDTVFSSKQGFVIYNQLLQDNLGYKSSWGRTRELVNEILQVYGELRECISQTRWGKQYSNLNNKEKVYVNKSIPIGIWIYPDRERFLYPLPKVPDSISYEVYKLLDSLEMEFEIDLDSLLID